MPGSRGKGTAHAHRHLQGRRDPVDDLVAAAAEAEADGFDSFWLPQIFGGDAITTLSIIGREVPRIELGTAVVPVQPRHPLALAAQALTAQAASGGRFTLGIGLSHEMVIKAMFGLSFDKPVRHMREYLDVLGPLIREGSVDVTGEVYETHASLSVPGSSPCPIVVAALGPQMLNVAARQAEGTITWMTGPATLESHTDPDHHEGGRRGRQPRAADRRLAAGRGHRRRRRRPRVGRPGLPGLRPAALLPGDARPRGGRGPADVALLGSEERGAGRRPAARRHRRHRLRGHRLPP